MTSNPTAELSAALDEVFRLRRALAYEAEVLRQHLNFRIFPKSRRDIAERQIDRMRKSACGDAESEYSIIGSGDALRDTMRMAGASPTLTRWEFIDECVLRHRLER